MQIADLLIKSWPIFLSLIFSLVWLIRLELRVVFLEKEVSLHTDCRDLNLENKCRIDAWDKKKE